MAYCTEADIESYLQTDIDNSFSSQISTWISAAQAWVDNYTKRTFEATTAVKKYDGNGEDFMNIDDVLSVDTIWFVSNDATSDPGTRTLASTEYYLYQNDDPNRTPYNRVELGKYGSYQVFYPGKQNIWVKGSFGYSAAAPEDIKMAVVKIVAGIINYGKNDGVRSYSEADLSVTYGSVDSVVENDLSIRNVLDWYKKKDRLTGFKIYRV